LLVLLPDVTALAVLQQHHLADRGALHQPVGAAEIELLQRRQDVDEVVPADHALRCGGNLLDLAGAACGKGTAGIGREAARLLDAIADHEGAGLGPPELVADLVAKPGLDIPGIVLQQLLRHLRIGIELVHRDALHADLGRPLGGQLARS
jgi:hypothetical protein